MVFVVISLFLIVCALFHLYLYRKVTSAFRPRKQIRISLAVVFIVMAVAPTASRLLDYAGLAALSRTISFPIFIWLAWMFWFFIGGITIEIWNWLLRLTRTGSRFSIPVRRQVYGLIVLILVTTGWSLYEARRPCIVEITLRSPCFKGRAPIRLVQISDVHVGMSRSEDWVQEICRMIESLKPDLLVSTGDLVDTSMRLLGNQANYWAALHPPLGKLAVLGNHEYYLGLAESLSFHNQAGFRVLRGETVDIGSALRVSGVDDYDGHRLGKPCFSDESALKIGLSDGKFNVLLKHRPTLSAAIAGRSSLQLSGHTHNGQLFPFKFFVWLNHRYTHGLYRPLPGFRLYVNPGVGTWGPPMRLFAPPEITVFTLAE